MKELAVIRKFSVKHRDASNSGSSPQLKFIKPRPRRSKYFICCVSFSYRLLQVCL